MTRRCSCSSTQYLFGVTCGGHATALSDLSGAGAFVGRGLTASSPPLTWRHIHARTVDCRLGGRRGGPRPFSGGSPMTDDTEPTEVPPPPAEAGASDGPDRYARYGAITAELGSGQTPTAEPAGQATTGLRPSSPDAWPRLWRPPTEPPPGWSAPPPATPVWPLPPIAEATAPGRPGRRSRPEPAAPASEPVPADVGAAAAGSDPIDPVDPTDPGGPTPGLSPRHDTPAAHGRAVTAEMPTPPPAAAGSPARKARVRATAAPGSASLSWRPSSAPGSAPA